jgi:hypothetical protein
MAAAAVAATAASGNTTTANPSRPVMHGAACTARTCAMPTQHRLLLHPYHGCCDCHTTGPKVRSVRWQPPPLLSTAIWDAGMHPCSHADADVQCHSASCTSCLWLQLLLQVLPLLLFTARSTVAQPHTMLATLAWLQPLLATSCLPSCRCCCCCCCHLAAASGNHANVELFLQLALAPCGCQYCPCCLCHRAAASRINAVVGDLCCRSEPARTSSSRDKSPCCCHAHSGLMR